MSMFFNSFNLQDFTVSYLSFTSALIHRRKAATFSFILSHYSSLYALSISLLTLSSST